MKKSNIVILGVSIIIIILLAAGIFLYRAYEASTKTTAEITGAKVPVMVKTTGTVKDVFVTSNQKVNKGQLIAEIEVQTEPNKKQISKPKTNITAAKSNLNKAEENYTNAAMMYKDGVISQEAYDESLTKLTEAQEAYKSAETQGKITTPPPSKAGLTKVEKVFAPNDGIIDSNYIIKKGDEAKQNNPLMYVSPAHPTVTAYVDDKTVNTLFNGQDVVITVKIMKDENFRGLVDDISFKPEIIEGYKTPVYRVIIKFRDNVAQMGFTSALPVSVKFQKYK